MDWTPRSASIVAALALLAMAPLGALGGLGILPDAPGGLVMMIVAALDVIVAVGLWRALGNGPLSVIAGALRLTYSAALAVAAALLSTGDRAGFEAIWQGALGVFGLHLVVAGLAVLVRAGVFTRITGALVLIAGLGYTVDATAWLLDPGVMLGGAQITFVGELVLIAWLFVRGGRPAAAGPRPVPAVA